MNNFVVKKFLQRYFNLVYRFKVKDKTIVLTFDDGPHPGHTEQIISILQKNDVKATFFIVGKKAENYPGLLRLINDKGHDIANHSYLHAKGENVTEGIKKTESILNNIIGKASSAVRPPWGAISLDLLLYCMFNKIKIVLWSFDSRDFKLKEPARLLEYVMEHAISNGDILLFHDDSSHTVEALEEIISLFKKRGYKFKTVKEMLGTNENII